MYDVHGCILVVEVEVHLGSVALCPVALDKAVASSYGRFVQD